MMNESQITTYLLVTNQSQVRRQKLQRDKCGSCMYLSNKEMLFYGAFYGAGIKKA